LAFIFEANQYTMTHHITVLTLACLSVTMSSCDRNEEVPDKLALLNSSAWVGSVETVRIEYDEENNATNQTTEVTPEGQYRLMILNDDQTAVVKYLCDKTNCTGDVYQAKWDFTGHVEQRTIQFVGRCSVP
jgi:hypothetical protein